MLQISVPFPADILVDVAELINAVQEDMDMISQMISLKEPCLHLVDWSIYYNGFCLLGQNDSIRRVMSAH